MAATSHPLYDILTKRPNAEMTPGRFMLMVVASICLRGNAFVEKKRVGNRVVALHPLLPQLMTVKRLDTGRLEYKYTLDGKPRVIAEDDLMHIRGFGLDGVCGMLPVTTGKEILGGAISAEEAAAKVFAQGMQASGILSSDTALAGSARAT